jgi:hypothetical protein
MPNKMTVVDKSKWTYQVIRRCQNRDGFVVREDFVGIPVTRERAIEVQTYKSRSEKRTGVVYIIKNIKPDQTKN